MKQLIIFICFFATIFGVESVVRVEEGELAGTTYTLPNGRVVDAFLGVPYAAPPIFKNRFKEPQQLKPWTGIWNASVPHSICLQIQHRNLYLITGDEDCLYLNIYTPKLPANGVNPLMDVMVYFHGGAFMFGSGGSYYPDYILQNGDVIYVSVNYRLGVLGFFSTDDDSAPGNFGLKDQVAALKWVHRNIIHFGGNPGSVTIAGCSAGGASVHYHFLSSMSEGLFQKGISMSGSVLPPWTLPRNNSQKSVRVAALVGCPTSDTREMVKCLQRRPARAILEQAKNFLVWRFCPFTAFGPVVEPASPRAFLSERPIDLLRSGKVKNLPWLTGVTEKEGLYPAAEFIPYDEYLKELNDKWNEISPNLLMYNYSVPEQEKEKISSAIKKFYLGDQPISKETITPLVQMLGDRLFYNDIIEASRLHNFVTQSDVYCYKFNYRGKYSLTNVYGKNSENYGSSHADDLLYLLEYLGLGTSSLETATDSAMVDLMTSIFTSFMKTGNPNTGAVAWEPIAKDLGTNFTCLSINTPSNLVIEDISNQEISKFWKQLLPNEYSVESVPVKDEL